MYMYFVFFKQKTAYEMRISDWSSDVCSSDLGVWPDEVNWQEGRSDPTLTRQICNGWKANRAIANVVLREDFGRAIAKMGGWPGTRIIDRKSVVEGQSVSVRVEFGGRRIIKKKIQ